jgi:regulatory protein
MKRQITDVQVQKKHPSRRSIFLDGKFFCGVSEEVAVKFGLKRGVEIDEDRLKELLYEEEFSKARNYTYKILARRMYTCKEIRDKLTERGYVDEIIENVIATLEGYGYLNDRTYAEEWIQSRMRSKPRGKIVLRQELARKGIEKSIIEEALSEAFDEAKEADMALDLARRKVKTYGNTDPAAAKRKLQGFLLRRGFNSETVRDVIEQVMENGDI